MRSEPDRATFDVPDFAAIMEFQRKTLPHDPPTWIDPTQEAFFITINCLPRGMNQLAQNSIWSNLIETIEYREAKAEWKWRLVLAMPDHLHGIVSFPNSFHMRKSISSWKRWIAKSQAINWQRDFFDHRLRTIESAVEKADYIRMNPVRAGLVEAPGQWPYVR